MSHSFKHWRSETYLVAFMPSGQDLVLVSDGCACMQALGEPIFTIPAAIQSNSYYKPPGNDTDEMLIRVGDADRAVSESPLSIMGARYCQAAIARLTHLSVVVSCP